MNRREGRAESGSAGKGGTGVECGAREGVQHGFCAYAYSLDGSEATAPGRMPAIGLKAERNQLKAITMFAFFTFDTL